MLIVKNKKRPCSDAKLLHIRGGLTTIVDSDLYDFLNQFKWFPLKSASTVYVVTRKIVKGRTYTIRLHRLITKAPDWMKVHHITMNNLIDVTLFSEHYMPVDRVTLKMSDYEYGFGFF